MEEERFFSCPRCGNEVNVKSRYCMKCGYLNPDHPENQQYTKYMKGSMEGYNVGPDGTTEASFQVNANETTGGVTSTVFGSKMGNYTLCFIVNFLLYILIVGLLIVFFYYDTYGNIYTMLASELSYSLIGFTVFSILNYSIQLVYMKMNRRWWMGLIPILNMYVLSDAIYEKKLLNLLVFVPIVGQIYYLVLLFKMGRSFGYSGFLTMVVPFIMFPVIGFGGSSFNKVYYVSGRDSLEQEYRKKKSFLITSIAVIVCSFVMVIYSNAVDINRGMDRLSSYYIYFASQRVIRRTKLKVQSQVYICDTYGDTFYFYFDDLEDYFSIPFYVYRDPIKGYVKVVRTEGGDGILDRYDYYISMTDLRYGFPETAEDDFNIESVVPYPELDPAYKSGNQCYFKRNA